MTYGQGRLIDYDTFCTKYNIHSYYLKYASLLYAIKICIQGKNM